MIILSFQSIFLAIVISEMCMKKIGVFAQPLINPPIMSEFSVRFWSGFYFIKLMFSLMSGLSVGHSGQDQGGPETKRLRDP